MDVTLGCDAYRDRPVTRAGLGATAPVSGRGSREPARVRVCHDALVNPTGPSHDPTPLVVLVHGAWHGAWCWSALASELDRRGIPSLAVDLPGHGTSTSELCGLHGDAEALRSWCRVQNRPMLLVGHSYGGAVITQAATPELDVVALVYVAAFQLDSGESVMSLLGSLERRPVALAAAQRPGETPGTIELDPELAPAALYGDASPSVASAAITRLVAESAASFTEVVTRDAPEIAWRRRASVYVVCERDEAIHPDHQRHMAARATTTVSFDADHSPFLTDPAGLAEVIETAWRAASDRTTRHIEDGGPS